MSRTHDASLGDDDDVYERGAYASQYVYTILRHPISPSFIAKLVGKGFADLRQTLDR